MNFFLLCPIVSSWFLLTFPVSLLNSEDSYFSMSLTDAPDICDHMRSMFLALFLLKGDRTDDDNFLGTTDLWKTMG